MQKEKKEREESEAQIYEALKEIVNRIKQEIENEKKERESAEETLLSLLDSACSKLNETKKV
jgi:hypothetical protein